VVETAICADPKLADLDAQLATAFSEALKQSTPAAKGDLISSERKWLRERNEVCTDKEKISGCLTFQYGVRLYVLKEFMSADAAGDAEIMFNGELLRARSENPATGPSQFNDSVRSAGVDGTVISCSIVMSVPLTHYETGYGGACVLRDSAGKKQSVLVCNDTGVGRFKLDPAGSKGISKHDLAQFTADNCTGG
jgi:hypothetical protein